MSLSDYEKYHLHDHVHTKSEIETKLTQLKTDILNTVQNQISNKKQYITIWAEQSGTLTKGNYKWSFGNGADGQAKYGYCMHTKGKILSASLCGSANGSAPGDIYVRLIINGVENTKYTIRKPTGKFSYVTSFKKVPLQLNSGDMINFKSHSTNGGVTHALVSLLIEIDI